MVSGSNDKQRHGHTAGKPVLPSPHVHSRQATLHTAHDSAHCLAGSYLIRTRSEPSRVIVRRRTSFKSPRKPGRMLHAIGARPESLTPSIHPKLGVTSRHKGLHRCALHRIFRPYLEDGVSTRILHRRGYDSIFFLHIQVLFVYFHFLKWISTHWLIWNSI